jgi:hypothetical protein
MKSSGKIIQLIPKTLRSKPQAGPVNLALLTHHETLLAANAVRKKHGVAPLAKAEDDILHGFLSGAVDAMSQRLPQALAKEWLENMIRYLPELYKAPVRPPEGP